jgi:hypothetical protein
MQRVFGTFLGTLATLHFQDFIRMLYNKSWAVSTSSLVVPRPRLSRKAPNASSLVRPNSTSTFDGSKLPEWQAVVTEVVGSNPTRSTSSILAKYGIELKLSLVF